VDSRAPLAETAAIRRGEVSMIGKVTALYAGLLALLLVAFSIQVIRLRWRYRQGLGDGGHQALARSVRVQGNFIEYAPLGLILVGLLELAGFHAWVLHGLGVALVAGRVAHGWGLSRSDGPSIGRAAGMFLTFSVLIFGGLLALYWALLT
jgi:uncharacterized membrane protein YecN with MAPEG domain